MITAEQLRLCEELFRRASIHFFRVDFSDKIMLVRDNSDKTFSFDCTEDALVFLDGYNFALESVRVTQ